jgi:hypothetical protein
VALVVAGVGAAAADDHYTMADFERVQKIDAHLHLHGPADRFMAQAAADGFRVLTINVDYPDFPPIDEQQRDAVSLRQRYLGRRHHRAHRWRARPGRRRREGMEEHRHGPARRRWPLRDAR